VLPRHHSSNSVAVALLRRAGGVTYLGLDDDDLPAAQCFSGHSDLWVAPAWRIPVEALGIGRARRFVAERLRVEFGIACRGMFDLGGRYHPSMGLTPEVVYPLAVDAGTDTRGSRSLSWVPLGEVVAKRAMFGDGHLRVVALRAAHALGELAHGAGRLAD
jgi:hypothetical protein